MPRPRSTRKRALAVSALKHLGWRVLHPDPGRRGFAICAIFKDEAPHLGEWLAFHRLMGVEHFFLYNNESSDEWQPVLAPYVAAGIAHVKDWTIPRPITQATAYEDCLKAVRTRVRWLACIDIDEFLFSPDGLSLPDAMAETKRPGVCAAWRVYGTGGLRETPPGLVIEHFRLRAREHHPLSKLGKPIVDPRRTLIHIASAHAFFHLRPGRPWRLQTSDSLQDSSPAPALRINHYYTKSEAQAHAKWDRGAIGHTENHSIPLAQYLDPALNEVRDEILVGWSDQVRRQIAADAALITEPQGSAHPPASISTNS